VTALTPIGPAELLADAPTVVTVDGARFVLATDADGDPQLFSAVCPHQRGRVRVVDETTLRCPNHRWEFDAESGRALDQDAALDTYDVTVADGTLRAALDG
jgi:CMP-N-acetylneuraminate monooxygenase